MRFVCDACQDITNIEADRMEIQGDKLMVYSRAAKPGYGVQGHHDPLNPLEEAAVNRLFEKPPKGAEKMRHGVQNHGDDLTAFQMAAVERMLAENKEDET